MTAFLPLSVSVYCFETSTRKGAFYLVVPDSRSNVCCLGNYKMSSAWGITVSLRGDTHHTCLHPLRVPNLVCILLVKANRRLKAICCPLPSKPQWHVSTVVALETAFPPVSTAAPLQKEWCWCGTKQLWQGRLEVIISCDRWGWQISYTAWTIWYPQRAFLAFWFRNSQVNLPLRKYKAIPPSIFCSQ